MFTADISKAFLQGVTYEEFAQLTGTPVREVNFYLPADNIPLLQEFQVLKHSTHNTRYCIAINLAQGWPIRAEHSP